MLPLSRCSRSCCGFPYRFVHADVWALPVLCYNTLPPVPHPCVCGFLWRRDFWQVAQCEEYCWYLMNQCCKMMTSAIVFVFSGHENVRFEQLPVRMEQFWSYPGPVILFQLGTSSSSTFSDLTCFVSPVCHLFLKYTCVVSVWLVCVIHVISRVWMSLHLIISWASQGPSSQLIVCIIPKHHTRGYHV